MISLIYHNKIVSSLIPTLQRSIKTQLDDCETVLDIGCGPQSPIRFCKRFVKSVGVEAYLPYLKAAQEKGHHTEYIYKDIKHLNFGENEFDAIMLIDVIEHMHYEDSLQLLSDCKRWARKKIIVSSPNGFVKQEALDGNALQAHLSGWTNRDMLNMGFRTFGMAGLKMLRKEVDAETMGNDMLVTMRFRPRLFWFIVSAVSQPIVYFFPKFAFSIFSVYSKTNEST